jgi:hypothetical protein
MMTDEDTTLEGEWHFGSANATDYPWFQEIRLFKHTREAETIKAKVLEKRRQEKIKEMKKPGPAAGDRNENNPIGAGIVVSTIVPIIHIPHARERLELGGQPNEWMTVTDPSLGETKIDIKNYTNHLKDPHYITLTNDVIKGKLQEWRTNSIQLLRKMHSEHMLPICAVRQQINFARFEVAKIIKGINLLKSVPISIMSEKAIQTYVQGVNDREKAQLVYSMANTRRFTVSVCNHDHQNNVSVVTMYNDNINELFAYGKQTIKDLTHMVRRPRVKKEKKDLKDPPQEIIEIKSNDDQQIITIEDGEHAVAGYTNNEQEQV